jgi:hypothetical protein
MSDDPRLRRAQRQALLVSRAELERLQMALLVHEIRDRVAPPSVPGRPGTGRGKVGRIAAALVAIGVPLLGPHRLSRWLRLGSLGLTAWRVARQWRGPKDR